MIAAAARLNTRPEGQRVHIDDPQWGGYLSNITPFDFAARFENRLPAQMDGAQFIAQYHGITDPVTQVQPDRFLDLVIAERLVLQAHQ